MQTKFITLFLLLPLFLGCSNSANKQSGNNNNKEAPLPLSEVIDNPGQFENKEISVSGLCIHTCRRSGKRLFLQTENKSQYLLVTASGNISKFDKELEGTNILVKGFLKKQSVREETHNHEEENGGCENEKRAMNYKLEATTVARMDNRYPK